MLTGGGRFADETNLPDQAYACMVRSPHAHALIASIDTEPAEGMPGVIAVLTGSDANLAAKFPGMPGAPSHGQNRGLAVGAADQAPRACDSAHGLTGKERAISRLVAPGSRVTSEPDPTTVSRSAPFIRSEPCVCRRVRGWDLEMLWQATRRWHHRRCG